MYTNCHFAEDPCPFHFLKIVQMKFRIEKLFSWVDTTIHDHIATRKKKKVPNQ